MAAKGVRATARGWYVGTAAMALAVLGVLVGVEELYALAASALVALAAAAAWARRQELALSAQLLVAPGRAPQGTPVQASVGLLNLGTRAAPPLALEVPICRQAGAHAGSPARAVLSAAAMTPGEQAWATLRLPTQERGLWTVGPVRARLTDPLGLFERRWSDSVAAGFAVHPHLVRLCPLPGWREGAQADASRHPGAAVTDELDGWRDYEPGDDMRRVHWKLTAKRDRLSVRQDLGARATSTIVLVDLREDHHYPGTLDTCAEAAASVLTALLRPPLASVVLATTAGHVHGPAPVPVPPELLYDALAAAVLHEGAAAAALATPGRPLHRPGQAPASLPTTSADLVVVIAATAEAGEDLASSLPVDKGRIVVVAACQRPPGATPLGTVPAARTGTAITVLWAGADLPAAWAALAAWGTRPRPWATLAARAGGQVAGDGRAGAGTTVPGATGPGVTPGPHGPLPPRRDWS